MRVIGPQSLYTRDDSQALFARGNCYSKWNIVLSPWIFVTFDNVHAVAASMQALRNASFMSEPSLLGIKALLILGVDLSRTGRAQDASALFGTTVRLAYVIDLHRDPDTLEPRPPHAECVVRRSTWWLMLYSDQHLSSMLCKPLAISSVGCCAEPEPLTVDVLELRLASAVHKLTVIAREILDYGHRIPTKEIDNRLAKLKTLWETIPDELQFETSWRYEEKVVPEWPLEVASASESR